MLEIIAIVFLTRALVRELRSRGRSAGWAVLGPTLWVLFEVAVIVAMGRTDAMTQLFMGILSGAVGGALSYVIVSLLPHTEWAREHSDASL